MKTILLALLFAPPLGAQPAVAPPQFGFVADSNRSLRPLLGIAGNFLLGDSLSEGVTDVASSAAFAMVKTSSSLAVLDRNGSLLFTMPAQSGHAVFAFSPDGQPAAAWLSSARSLYTWKGDRLEPLALNPADLAGDVVALSQDRLVVQRTDGLWLLQFGQDGSLLTQAALPGIASPVLLDAAGSLSYADGTALVLRASGGSERRIETGVAIARLAQLSSGWVRLAGHDSRRQYAVCIAAGSERSLQLPEGATCCGR